MSQPEPLTLADLMQAGAGAGRAIATSEASLRLDELSSATSLGEGLERLDGRSVILMAGDPLKTAAALIELDGRARRIVLCPPDLEARHLPAVARDAGATRSSMTRRSRRRRGSLALAAPCALPLRPRAAAPAPRRATEWVLLTSGTTGDPKMVVHTLATLTGADPAAGLAGDGRRTGRRSTTSGATAACRSSCAPSPAAAR